MRRSSIVQPKAGDSYWLVAIPCADEHQRDEIFSLLRNRITRNDLAYEASLIDIPLDLKYGSFDDLIRLADELLKSEDSCEQILRRIERQALEIDPKAELRILWQRNELPYDTYLRRFQWVETRYSRLRHLRDNVDQMVNAAVRIDEEVKLKSVAYNEVKQIHSNMLKRATLGFGQRDLAEVLTPDVGVDKDDFIETEHLTTAICIVPSGLEVAWKSSYESLDDFVVPRSTKKYTVIDKDGNTLWRVLVMKKFLPDIIAKAREKRFTIRPFRYNLDILAQRQSERAQIEAEKSKQEAYLRDLCGASFSESAMIWTHIKVCRVFVEAVLRYGVPPHFASFVVRPNPSREKRLRKELNDVFTERGLFGRTVLDAHFQVPPEVLSATGDRGEEYYHYVSVTMMPFLLFTQK